MNSEECEEFFNYIISREKELNNLDRTSLLKSMADIPFFKLNHQKTILETIFSKMDTLQLRDLNHILLAYFTQPVLLTED